MPRLDELQKLGSMIFEAEEQKGVYHILMTSYFWEHQFPDIL